MCPTPQPRLHTQHRPHHSPENRLPALLATLFLHLLPSIFFGIVALFFDEAARFLNRAALVFHPPPDDGSLIAPPPSSHLRSADDANTAVAFELVSQQQIQHHDLEKEQHHHPDQTDLMEPQSPPPEPKSMSSEPKSFREPRSSNQLLPLQLAPFHHHQHHNPSVTTVNEHSAIVHQPTPSSTVNEQHHFTKSNSTPASNWPCNCESDESDVNNNNHDSHSNRSRAYASINSFSTFVSSITPDSSSSSIPSKNVTTVDINNSSFFSRPSYPKLNAQVKRKRTSVYRPTHRNHRHCQNHQNQVYSELRKAESNNVVLTNRAMSGSPSRHDADRIPTCAGNIVQHRRQGLDEDDEVVDEQKEEGEEDTEEDKTEEDEILEDDELKVKDDLDEVDEVEDHPHMKPNGVLSSSSFLIQPIKKRLMSKQTTPSSSRDVNIDVQFTSISLSSSMKTETEITLSGTITASPPEAELINELDVRTAVTDVDTSESPTSSSEQEEDDEINDSDEDSVENMSSTSPTHHSRNQQLVTTEPDSLPGTYVARRVNDLEQYISSDSIIKIPLPPPPLPSTVRTGTVRSSVPVPPTILLRSIYAEDLTFIHSDDDDSVKVHSPSVVRASTALFSEHAGDSSEEESTSSERDNDVGTVVRTNFDYDGNVRSVKVKAPTSGDIENLLGDMDFDLTQEDFAPSGVDSLRELIIPSDFSQHSHRTITTHEPSKRSPSPLLPQLPPPAAPSTEMMREISLSHNESNTCLAAPPFIKRGIDCFENGMEKASIEWKHVKHSTVSTHTESYSSPNSASTSEGGSGRTLQVFWKKDEDFFNEEPSLSDLGHRDDNNNDTETANKKLYCSPAQHISSYNTNDDDIIDDDDEGYDDDELNEDNDEMGIVELSMSEYDVDRDVPSMVFGLDQPPSILWSPATTFATSTTRMTDKVPDRPRPEDNINIENDVDYDDDNDDDDDLLANQEMSRGRWSAPVNIRPVRPLSSDHNGWVTNGPHSVRNTRSIGVNGDALFRQASIDVTMLPSSRNHMNDRPRQNSASGMPSEALTSRRNSNFNNIKHRTSSSSTPSTPPSVIPRIGNNRRRPNSLGSNNNNSNNNNNNGNTINNSNYRKMSGIRSAHFTRNINGGLMPINGIGATDNNNMVNSNGYEDWPEYSVSASDRADEISRLSRRHASDMSFGANDRKVDLLPPELLGRPDDNEYEEFWDLPERFGGRSWRRGRKRFNNRLPRESAESKKGGLKQLLMLRSKRRTTSGGWGGIEERKTPSKHINKTRIGASDSKTNTTNNEKQDVDNEDMCNCVGSGNDGKDTTFESELDQDTVFGLLNRICAECGFNVIVRRGNFKMKMEVTSGGDVEPLLVSMTLCKNGTQGKSGTLITLTRSKDDISGGHLKDIQSAGILLKQRLDSHVEFIEDSFASLYVDGSGTTTDMESHL